MCQKNWTMTVEKRTLDVCKTINDNDNKPNKKASKREQPPFLIHWRDGTSWEKYKVGDTKYFNGNKKTIVVIQPHTGIKSNGTPIPPNPAGLVIID